MNRSGSTRRRLLLALGATSLAAIALVLALSPLRWRAHLLALQVTGAIPDIELTETLAFMMPSSEQAIVPMIETRNPYEVIRNPRTTLADVRSGGELLRQRGCAACHGGDASGGPGGPPLNRGVFKSGATDWALFRTIRHGVSGTAMAAHDLPEQDIWQIISYLRFMQHPEAVNPALGRVQADVRVSVDDLLAAKYPREDWITYSGAYSGWRHSALDQIKPANVRQLTLKWIHAFEDMTGEGIEATPLVRNGIMFLTALPSRVVALDASNGRTIWEFRREESGALKEQYGGMNRGVALLGEHVFFGTRDGQLFALSATSGEVRWKRQLSTDADKYFVSMAPLAVRDLVVVGVGTRNGGRGFIVAFDAKTGAERWRFHSIPGPGEPGHESWAGESWRDGGGPTWMTGSYDAEQDLLIWGVGNPKPDYDKTLRAGDNLYTNSVVALRGATGKLVWHFQFTPGDDHDWDSAQVPMLVDGPNGEKRVLWANRNGYYYVLDRTNGKFVTGVPFVKQNWTLGLDRNGRPILPPDSLRRRFGSVVWPGNVGGTNWWPPSYDPNTNTVFVPSLEQGMVFFSSNSSWPVVQGGETFYTAVRALDPMTGARKWEYQHPRRLSVNKTGGLTTTTTGLLFGGDLRTFFALDSRTGAKLWSVETGGVIMAAPSTYAVHGDQYVTIAAGKHILTFGLPDSGEERHPEMP